jgi:hypothetical protein
MIADYNWLKLRDLAFLLNGTEKQFQVGWNEATNTVTITSNMPYAPVVGDELRELPPDVTAIASPQRFILDGHTVSVAAYNINGYNYFRLRDIAILLDFDIDWQPVGEIITLDLSKRYEGN